MYRFIIRLVVAASLLGGFTAAARADGVVAQPSAAIGDALAAGGPVHVRVRLSGERVWTRLRALADLSERIARAPDLVLVDRVPPAVDRGLQRGYLLEVRLASALTRDGGQRLLRCAMHQSIFDLKLMALRGSASQRGEVPVPLRADGATLSRIRSQCFAALVPAVYDGLDDYLARARR